MSSVFLRVCNLALTAGWVALFVMAARLVLRRAPRRLTCLLWAVVALRLLLPFSFQSMFSLIPSAQPLPENIATAPVPQIDSGIAAVDRVVNPVLSETLTPTVGASINPMQLLLAVGSVLWLVGIAAMLIWAAVSYLRIRRRVRVSLATDDGVYLCDDIDTPFILGIFRPRIYLPSALSEDAKDYVMAHERAHLRRLDHLFKPLGFVLLSVYWFQPLLWVAYVWLCRDIEAACDECVIRDMDGGDRKRYSEALLTCSVRGRAISACPLAFGEVGVKARVRAVLNYKRPAFWLILAAVLLSIFLTVALLSDPWQTPADALEIGTSWADEDGVLELTVHEHFEILGTLKIGDEAQDVRMVFRERYAEIYRMGDTDYDHPLLKCGLRVRGRRMHLIVREDAANTGLTRLVLNSCVLDPAISQISQDIHTEYEGIYLDIDYFENREGETPTLHTSWHNDTADVEAMYGEPYAIDYWNGSDWIDLTPPNMSFALPGYLLSPGESREKTYSTEPFDLPLAGRYRLRSSFSIQNLPYKEWFKTGNNYETWVEFEVKEGEWGVQTDEETKLARLKEWYPEYFELDTTNGVTVYVWQMAAGSYSCGLLAGSPDSHEDQEVLLLGTAGKPSTTIENMKIILRSYGLPSDKIHIEATKMMYSSYFYKIDDAYIWSIRNKFGEDSVIFDLDRDGQQEFVSIFPGFPVSEGSLRLYVYDTSNNQQEYAGVFESPLVSMWLELMSDGKLYLCSTEHFSDKYHRYDVTMQDGVVSITENGVPIGGEIGE
ncbi:MAG: hypothetical protein IJY66_03845 [Clostridia bacterium]|nr:hypothetical protein [Clostridia bacterium]